LLRLPCLQPRGKRLHLLGLPIPSAALVRGPEERELRILGHAVKVPSPLDWQSLHGAAPSRLWRFHLHYQEFLLNCEDEAASDDLDMAWQFLDGWLAQFGNAGAGVIDDVWHPYVVSRRIPVWVELLQAGSLPEGTASRMMSCLAAQARWLADNLEWDVCGNHLLQNLRGLAVAGAFFCGDEADAWLHRVGRILRDQVREQVLPHGEHFERASGYHIDMLMALADIRAAGHAADVAWAAELDEPIERMVAFLRQIVHPDGQIPLFGDSSLDLYPTPREVLERIGHNSHDLSRKEAAPARIVGDYWVFRTPGEFLILDAGPVGPDHLPAHAHADLLNIEASWQGSRLFVDGGVATYEDSPERAFCRGTSVHNVLEIDDRNQCDVWSRFRMGRRGRTGRLRYGSQGPFHWAWCAHNAYRFLGVPKVGRLIVCIAGGPWILFDWAEGRQAHRFVDRLRLGPDWKVVVCQGKQVIVGNESHSLIVRSFPESPIRVGPARYYPRFGQLSDATELLQECRSNPPFHAAWIVSPRGDEPATLSFQDSVFRLNWQDSQLLIKLA